MAINYNNPDQPQPLDDPNNPRRTTMPVTPPGGNPPGIPIPSMQPGMTANAGETPEQTAQRYQKDYWAPDRNQVLGTDGQNNPFALDSPPPPGSQVQTVATQMGAGPQGGQGGQSAFDGSSFYGKTDPASVNSYVQGMLKGTGREGDAQMWANYITSKGGGPNSYWDNLITKNIGGDAAGGGGGGKPGGGAYVPGQGVPGQGSIFGAQGGNQRTNALEDLLMKRAGQNIIPSPNDPVIKAQTDAFSAQQERGARNYETQAAEKGGPNANPEAVQRSMAEQGAQATGAFEGQAMQRELDARRQEVQAALSGAQGMLTQEEQMQLEEELAQLGLASNAYQYDTSRQDKLAGF
jgi:hypothetical protein